jgi:hypothetical protein
MQSACVYQVSTLFMGDGFQFPKLTRSRFSLCPRLRFFSSLSLDRRHQLGMGYGSRQNS